MQPPGSRAVHRFTETATRSNSLFLRNSGRKSVSHFSWNCSKVSRAQAGPAPALAGPFRDE
ncbi:MAG: hypothetical protein EOR12_24350 [Mesorhizobium sp.]|nr:MAG: hypothetical protein EOR12_24350 [Mesorhizobium sp.]